MTGNVLIHSNQNRLSQYYVWSYGPGNDTFYKYMYVDFSASPDKVRSYSAFNATVSQIDETVCSICVYSEQET